MIHKSTYEELSQRVKKLEKEAAGRRMAEERIQHLNLVLRAIRDVNQLITREKDRRKLLEGVCERIIRTRGYFNAWIALLDASGSLVMTAEAGSGGDAVQLAELLQRGEVPECGRQTLTKSEVVVTHDPVSRCTGCPLSAMYGGRGGMTVRLEHGGNTYGLLCASIPKEFTFDEEERALFKELAGDVASALHNMDVAEERIRAEEELQKSHDDLERRVEARTAELVRTNDELKREIEERRRAEEALRVAHGKLAEKAAALQTANEEISQYAYVVSHDLRAPLRAIRNYADFLREDLAGAVGANQKKYLDGLGRAVLEGEELVDDLLEFSRVGRSPAPVEPIDLGVFLRELTASLGLPGDVEVVMPDEWPTIDASARLLRQVFRNLIGNAVKFNHSPRKRVELGWRSAGRDRFEFFVRDNGIGIDPRHHEQIFKVFFRLHTRAEYEGTGIGLAIVRKATSMLNGSVRVESMLGEGSTFFVEIPRIQKEKPT